MNIKKILLGTLLSTTLLLTSVFSVQASAVETMEDKEQNTSTRSGDDMIDALETVKIGKAKYRLYTCTILLSNASEGKIDFSIQSYEGASSTEITRIKSLSKTMSLDVSASFIGGSTKNSRGSNSIKGVSGNFSQQSGSGTGLLYSGFSTGTFSCSDGSWTRNTSCSRFF